MAASRARISSAFLRSVMSRGMRAAPITLPSVSRTGETLSEMLRRRPDFVTRMVSRPLTISPDDLRNGLELLEAAIESVDTPAAPRRTAALAGEKR